MYKFIALLGRDLSSVQLPFDMKNLHGLFCNSNRLALIRRSHTSVLVGLALDGRAEESASIYRGARSSVIRKRVVVSEYIFPLWSCTLRMNTLAELLLLNIDSARKNLLTSTNVKSKCGPNVDSRQSSVAFLALIG